MLKYASHLFLFLTIILGSCKENKEIKIDGELKKWHRVVLNFEGPKTSETDDNNPFLNYRLDVTFKNGKKEYVIPGFYAVDGDAANTSSDSGNIWQVRFTPDAIGEWTFSVSFK